MPGIDNASLATTVDGGVVSRLKWPLRFDRSSLKLVEVVKSIRKTRHRGVVLVAVLD